MNKNDLMILIMAKKTLDYQKDPNPENWRTIKGAKVHIDENGKIDGGAGGKFNGKGALPRSMFSGTGKQTEFAEVTEKKKEIAERAQKEKETQKAERKKERAAAQKTKREEKRKLEKERPELKQKFNDLRESYLKETDPKKKRELRNQALEVSQEYFKKYGNHPDNDGKPKEKKGKSDVGEKGLAYLRSISHVNSSAEEETGYTARTMIDMINKGKTLEEIRTELRKNIDKYSHDVDNDYQHLDKMIEAVKRADKGEAKEPKKSASKSVPFKKPSYELAKQISDLSNGIVYTGEKSDDPNKPYVVHHPKWGKITTATHPEEMLKKLKQMKEDNERRKKEPKGEELPW